MKRMDFHEMHNLHWGGRWKSSLRIWGSSCVRTRRQRLLVRFVRGVCCYELELLQNNKWVRRLPLSTISLKQQLIVAWGAFTQIDDVLIKTAKADSISLPPHVSRLLSMISNGNLRRALLSLEALYTQDHQFKTILPSHSLLSSRVQSSKDLEVVPRPDWEKYASKAAERLLAEQTPARLLEVRGMLYELLVHCIPAPLVLSVRLGLFPSVSFIVGADE